LSEDLFLPELPLPIFAISSAGRSKGTGMNQQGYRLDSRRGRGGSNTNSKHPLSIPHDSRWGSDERIVPDSDAKTTSSGEELSLPMQIEDRQHSRDVDVERGASLVRKG